MLNEIINKPKTKAGQYEYHENQRVIKERITSFGSSAIVERLQGYIIIYWDIEANSYALSYCGFNMRILKSLWEEIV